MNKTDTERLLDDQQRMINYWKERATYWYAKHVRDHFAEQKPFFDEGRDAPPAE